MPRQQTRNAGASSLNDFLGQKNNELTFDDVLRTLLPVQEMREFQRRYKFIPGEQLVPAGDRLAQVRFIVPPGEFWRPLTLMYANFDTSNHNIETRFTLYNGTNPAISIYTMTNVDVVAGNRKIVYGMVESGLQSIDRYTSLLPVIMEPSDVFVLTDLTVSAGDPTQEWLFVYEIVPGPSVLLARGAPGLVTIV